MQYDSKARQRADSGALLDALREAGVDVHRPNAIRCPFHDDQHPSAGVYQADDGAWRFKCHGCGYLGDVYDVRAKVRNTTAADELKAACGQGVPLSRPKHQLPDIPKAVYPSLNDLVESINRRDHGRKVVQVDPFRWPSGEIHGAEIRIEPGHNGKSKDILQSSPYDGGFVLRGPKPPHPLFNLGRVQHADRVVVVEGPKTVRALEGVGITSTTNMGGAGKASLTDWSPLAGKTCVLWPDCDPPDDKGKRTGIAHMRDVAKLLETLDPPTRVLWLDPDLLDLPEKGDAADFIDRLEGLTIEQKQEAVDSALGEAVSIGPSAEVDAMVQDAIAGRRRCVPWPWTQFGVLTKALSPATVTLLVASPGATKSLALIQAVAWWHEQGERVAVLELEDGRAFHLRRAMAQAAGEGGVVDDDWCKQHPETALSINSRHVGFMDSLGSCIHELPGDTQPTMDSLVGWIERQAIAGKRIIAVDPLSIAEAQRDQYLHDQRFIARVKHIVEQSGCSLILVMHPKKHAQGRTTDDIAGGAAFGRLSQTVIWLEHTGEPKHVTVMDSTLELPVSVEVNRIVHLVKTRNARGQGLRLGFHFDQATLRLRECGVIIRNQGSVDT